MNIKGKKIKLDESGCDKSGKVWGVSDVPLYQLTVKTELPDSVVFVRANSLNEAIQFLKEGKNIAG